MIFLQTDTKIVKSQVDKAMKIVFNKPTNNTGFIEMSFLTQ